MAEPTQDCDDLLAVVRRIGAGDPSRQCVTELRRIVTPFHTGAQRMDLGRLMRTAYVLVDVYYPPLQDESSAAVA